MVVKPPLVKRHTRQGSNRTVIVRICWILVCDVEAPHARVPEGNVGIDRGDYDSDNDEEQPSN